jgi:transposase
MYVGGMSRPATPIRLSAEERLTLEQWVRSSRTEQRFALRAHIILAAAEQISTQAIAVQLQVRPATVSKWRQRYAARGLAGLQDAPRPGGRRRYHAETERRILRCLDIPPPSGHATWTGTLVAHALGDVTDHHVWAVLRRHGIHLQRRRSWCISTDPAFAAKAADIVGLYLHPPDNAVVLSVDEKPHIQALERAQGYLRLANGQALAGFSHEYTRHGTTTLFAALNVATGQVKAGHYRRRRRREFLDFMNDLLPDHPHREIHVILDNLNTHKPKHDRWRIRHPNVHFHDTPTHASWLNQIECWFSILTRRTLKGASFTSPRQLRDAINRFIAAYNEHAAPFVWQKAIVHPVALKYSYAQLRK